MNELAMKLDLGSGNATDKPKKKLHETLSKYGLGKAEVSKKEEVGLHVDLNDDRSLADEEGNDIEHKIGETKEDSHILANGQQIDAIYSLNDVKKVMMNEVLEESNGSHVKGFRVCSKGKESKREDGDAFLAERFKRIMESHEVNMKTEKVEETDKSDSGLDSLNVIEEIVFNLNVFVDYIFLMLKDGWKVEFQQQEKTDMLHKVCLLLEKMSQRVRMIGKTGNAKIDENQKEGHFQEETCICQILTQLIQISACLERSFNIALDSLLKEEKCTENELSLCEGELNHSKEELSATKLRIREMKTKKQHASPENGSTEMQKDTEVLKMEDNDATEESEKWEHSCVPNDYICCAFPQFPDIIGR